MAGRAKPLPPPTSVAELLGKKVRAKRDELGWTQEALGRRVRVAHNRIAQIEHGTDPPNEALTALLDAVLDMGGELVELWEILSQEGFKDYAKVFLTRQALARSIREFSLTIPGLLQTAAYARAMMGFGVHGYDVEPSVALRIARQELLESDDSPWMWVVLEEAALTRVMGSRDVMREQLQRLIDYAERDHIHVQVLRRDRPCVPGAISLLTMRDGARYAYTEGYGTGRLYERMDDVERYTRIYDQVHADALGTEASAAFIHAALGKVT